MINYRKRNKNYLKCTVGNFGFTAGKIYRVFTNDTLAKVGRIEIRGDTGKAYYFKFPQVYEYFEQL